MQNYIEQRILDKPSKMISYSEYIQLALYHPQFGYYMKDKEKVGTKGDFITTSNISDIYGRIVAKWYLKKVSELELEPSVCEIGAGNGRFAKSFIEEWQKLKGPKLHYYILEESPYHRELQKQILPFDTVCEHIENLTEVNSFEGLVFSNELFDALPVHVIEKRNGELMEVMISVEQSQLVEKFVPLENQQINDFLRENNLNLREKQRIEIPLIMKSMITTIADVLAKGIVITVDYGYTNEEWMEPIHQKGSLRGYYKHQQIHNVLEKAGEMDITSHVHFDAFIKSGREVGLNFVNKLRQDQFFVNLGLLEELQDNYDPNPFSERSKQNRAIRSLILPSEMSAYFHVIVQEKGLNEKSEQIMN